MTPRLLFRGLCSNEADPSGLRHESAVARLVGMRVRIPRGACISVSCVLLGRGVCDELITRPEESYRLRCI
jgi:hypothetical protein